MKIFLLVALHTGYSYYGCYCGFLRFIHPDEELDRCCRTRDNCLAQVTNLDNCAFLIRNLYTSSYSYSCSGNDVTYSDKNNLCEAVRPLSATVNILREHHSIQLWKLKINGKDIAIRGAP
ncbi:phospholipase A2, minor isoenzyme-like [Peromyscus maniculatus bairdii]|uniref:phospholipase A2, minor isoenzyme-like n=1 Tax=Peromyscus maniculatus bairdii TaxID=230844 RepID=UPI003FD127A3